MGKTSPYCKQQLNTQAPFGVSFRINYRLVYAKKYHIPLPDGEIHEFGVYRIIGKERVL